MENLANIMEYGNLIGWLVGWLVLWRINLCRLFNAKFSTKDF